MHNVTCPKCRRVFRLSRPVSQTKMKCECGAVFVGSSTPEPAVPPGLPAGSPLADLPVEAPSHPQFRPHARRRYNPVLVAGTLVLTLAVLVGVALAIYYKQKHPKVLVRDEGITRQATPEEVARYLAKVNPAHAKESAPANPQEPQSLAEATPDTPQPAAMPANASAPAPQNDSRVDPGTPQVKTSDVAPDCAYFVGAIRNLTDKPFAKLTIKPLVDAQPIGGANGAALEQSYDYIPPRGRGSVSYSIEVRGQIDPKQITLVAQATEAPEDLLVWDAGQDIRVSQPDEDGVTTVSGSVKNVNDTPVGQVEIYCDCYDIDGILVGSGHGKADVQSIDVNKSAAFSFAVSGKGLFAARQIQARAVAKRN